MLSDAQETELDVLVERMGSGLHAEEASLDEQQTLEVVLCRDTVCFRPLRITMQEVDVSAALAGEAEAQQALQAHLRQSLQGLI